MKPNKLGEVVESIPLPIVFTATEGGDAPTPQDMHEQACKMAGINPRWVDTVGMESDSAGTRLVVEMKTIRIPLVEP
ncbi:hypothetical protein ACK8HH_17230 [Gordonia sp. LUNF6]|uniref:hypothetical protein n=1 Tax=unclassified Gordonia (in: high G+C Gram-positive bacteria) TaxID=2657482 RepID=UPI0007827E8C|nr:hypothetical protein [Gordonia sp. QH-12]KXT57344.1 hypothetical protein Y710_09630 [Gordonia sp. QH-12]